MRLTINQTLSSSLQMIRATVISAALDQQSRQRLQDGGNPFNVAEPAPQLSEAPLAITQKSESQLVFEDRRKIESMLGKKVRVRSAKSDIPPHIWSEDWQKMSYKERCQIKEQYKKEKEETAKIANGIF